MKYKYKYRTVELSRVGAWQLWLVGGLVCLPHQTPGAADPCKDFTKSETCSQTWSGREDHLTTFWGCKYESYESSAICPCGCPISKAVIYESRLAPIEEGAHLRNKLLVLQNHKTAVSLPLNQGLKPGHHLTSAKVFAKWSGFWKIDKTIGNVMVWLHITLSHQQKWRFSYHSILAL